MTPCSNRPIRPGDAFRDGKLFSFTKEGIIVASQWPDMRAWRKTPKGKHWMHIRPGIYIENTKEGWRCTMGFREGRQGHKISGDHILGRLGRQGYDPGGFLDEEPFGDPEMPDEDDDEDPEEWDRAAWWNHIDERNRRAQSEYLSPIPEGVLTSISAFANRHWHLLNLVGRCPGALDLVRSTPALALALSSPWVFRKNPPKRPLRSARSLLARRQTNIAAWLGFPGGRSTVKILRKLPPSECTVLNLLHLRDLFGTRLKLIRHLPLLNGPVIRLVAGETDRYRVSPGFLHEITAQPNLMDRAMRILRDTLWMREALKEPGLIALLSFDHLTRAHDRFVDRMGRGDLRIIDPTPFPPPPLVPSSPQLELQPLQSENDLLEEGRIQKNCVGAYAPRVHTGKVYLYRLLAPERATLAVSPDQSGKWRLNEIKAHGNEEISPETLSAVRSWIDGAGCASSCECDEDDPPF